MMDCMWYNRRDLSTVVSLSDSIFQLSPFVFCSIQYVIHHKIVKSLLYSIIMAGETLALVNQTLFLRVWSVSSYIYLRLFYGLIIYVLHSVT